MTAAYAYDCIERYQTVGREICKAMLNEAEKIGFDKNSLPDIEWHMLNFSVGRDPADGGDCLTGEWKNIDGFRVGQIQFNSDGSFFAEHDIVRAHPGDKRWFVEAVEAWGRDQNISTEPRLLVSV